MKERSKPIVLDNNVLVAWCDQAQDPNRIRRLDYLLLLAKTNHQRIILPTPVIAEFLAIATEARRDFLDALKRSPAVSTEPFDERSAVEASLIYAAALASRDPRYGTEEPKQKIKVDTQIVAIAKVHDAGLIVTGDAVIHKIARTTFISASTIEDLPLPPENLQRSLLDTIAN